VGAEEHDYQACDLPGLQVALLGQATPSEEGEAVMSKQFVVRTSGYDEHNRLVIDPGPSRCGDIDDGISLWHHGQGGWVISMADLTRIYQAAVKVRQKSAKP
jgi:hypothetical protein